MSVYLPSTSTFSWMESQVSSSVHRQMNEGTRENDFWGVVIFPLTLVATPLTILADMVMGVAHIVIGLVTGELDEDKFWKICDQHFFVFPFQQLIFFVFSIIGTLYHRNYVDGYLVGQQCVIEFSRETYDGHAEIFEKIYYRMGHFEPFPGLTMSDEDRLRLDMFKDDGARFLLLYEKKASLPDSSDETIGPILDRVKSAESAYLIFMDEPPHSMYQVTETFKAMKRTIKESEAITLTEKGPVLDYLHAAHDALSAFFQVPNKYRTRLLATNPQLPMRV